MKYLFITGMARSGTTLIEKILHNHPRVGVGSQPFPTIFFNAKSKFYAHKHLRRRYPLGHMFQEHEYHLGELNAFLESCVFAGQEIDQILHDLSGYSGQYMPEFVGFCRGRIEPGTFYEVYKQFLSCLAKYLAKQKMIYVGSKETWLEEYIPYFLNKGVKSIIIVRDPRDIIASLNFGEGAIHGGEVRPLLYILRHWRKSVMFCLQYKDDIRFNWLKYENLVKNSEFELTQLTSFLGLVPFDENSFSQGIVDQKGDLWMGNSSFGKYSFISSASVEGFKVRLSEPCIRYIESVCHPELQVLGYEFLYCQNRFDEEAICDFKEPLPVTHKKFEPDYSQNPFRIKQEIQRLKKFEQDLSEVDQRKWFLFPKAYQIMKKALEDKTAV